MKPGSRRQGTVAATMRIFWSGRSKAVRLPKRFRFDVAEVTIRREGERIILEPLQVGCDEEGWPLACWELAGTAPDFGVRERDAPHARGRR